MIDTASLNDAQRQAVLHDRGPLLVLAGAGSGKTRVVTMRIARLLLTGEAPRSILAVTFTNKAAKEMKERLTHIAGKSLARGVWVSTFHSLCARILRRDAHRIGISVGFTILDESDQTAQLSRVAKEQGLKLAEKEPRLVLGRIGLWKNLGYRRDTVPAHIDSDPIALLAARLWVPYGAHLRALSALDFDDLLLCARELLESTRDVRRRYQALFRFIHIDEYQDTNPIQLEITKLLCGPEKNLCVVGDDDQAIYSFRGADLENIRSFDQQFQPCTVVKLEQNYRSTGLILDSANAVIKSSVGRRDKTLFSTLGDGKPLVVVPATDGDEEADLVTSRIHELVMQEKVPAEHIALLYRAAPQSRLFEEGLRLRGVPYRVIGGMEFFQRKEVKDTLAYLSCIAFPDEELPFRRAVNLPARGLGDKAVERVILAAREQGVPLVEMAARGAPGVPLKDQQVRALEGFGQPLIAAQRALASAGADPDADIAGIARDAILDAGLRELMATEAELAAREKINECIDEVIDAFAGFVDRQRDASESPDLEESRLVDKDAPPLAAFLDRLALDDEERERNKDKNEKKQDKGRVQLMSLHASKGLEFPVVFLVGIEEGLLPHRRVLEENGPNGVDEERRLMYVGITRAQRLLTLSWARTRRRRHDMVVRKRSRFVDDIPPRCLGLADGETAAPAEPADPASAFFASMNARFGRAD